MDALSKVEFINGIIWLTLGVLIVVWLIASSEALTTFIWAGFAVGCVLTGLWMIIDPIIRKKSE